MRLFILVLIGLFYHGDLISQCCSPGNPAGGITNIGILDKKLLRFISFYRYSFSEGYWEGTKKSDYNFVKNGQFNYAGIILSYGLLDKLTVETELGYFISKSQTYNIEPVFTHNGTGLNNAVLSLKYNIFKNSNNPFEWTLGIGGKFPFSTQYKTANNVELPIDVQPSTNAFGIVTQSFLYKSFPNHDIQLFFINRNEFNYPDIKNYKYGNAMFNSFFITKRINKSNWTAIAQARYEMRGRDIANANSYSCFATGTQVNSSGGHLIFVAPQINYNIAQKWNLSFLADLPVYRNYYGRQLGNKMAFSFYLLRDFGGGCEKIDE